MLSLVLAAALLGAPTPRAAAAHAGTVVFVERVGGPWAAAAVRSHGRLHGVALKRTTGGWTIAPASPRLRIRPLGPLAAVSGAKQQVAAEIDAPAPVRDSALWVDGRVVNVSGGGPSARRITMFGTATVSRGRHVVLAFARTDALAAAVAWQFTRR